LAQLKLTQLNLQKVSLYKILDDGTKRIQQIRYEPAGNKLKALIEGLGEYELVENLPTFGDVTGNGKFGWAKQDIEIMAAKEIIKGRGENLFDPGNKVTRAEFITMLVRAMGLKTDANLPVNFKDIQAGEWYRESIGTAVAVGITKGFADGNFQPNKQISRLEMALLLSRAASISGGKNTSVTPGILKQFKDYKKVPVWAAKDLSFAVQMGLLQGKGKDKLAFAELGNRAEATVLIKRYFDRYGIAE
jgi:minor extracellular serine protease Vpr